MLQGTFRAWVEDGSYGVFANTDETSFNTTVQATEDKPGEMTYEVIIGHQMDGLLWAREYHFKTADEVVASRYCTWETQGDVTDG